jgi:CheY-like chemotaxis protein
LNQQSCKVLVVDYDRDNADTTVMLLQLWGHEAEAAYSGAHAVDKAKALDPDVVLMDLGLPITNGFDLANELRRYCPAAKFLALTGYTPADIVPRSREVGFVDVLVKPTPAHSLKEAVESHCESAPRAAS